MAFQDPIRINSKPTTKVEIMSKRLLELEPTGLFGEEAIITSFSGREEMSRLFDFSLSIASHKENIKAEDVIGQPLAVRIDRADKEPHYFTVTSATFGLATLLIPKRKADC